jgi:ribose 1,5-bisphosphate isomerase
MEEKTQIPEIIQRTIDDIVAIKVQGATNVALATFEAIQEWASTTDIKDWTVFKDKVGTYATMLANARPNEPLAKNGVRYLLTNLTLKYHNLSDVKEGSKAVAELAGAYNALLKQSKVQIVKHGLETLQDPNVIFTHCHSSTAEAIIVGLNERKKLSAIATETRPLFQGRITAKNLVSHGVKTIMIVDSAAAFFIKDDTQLPVDAVFLGADQINVYGDTVNKVGSFSMALSAYFASKPLYIVTPSLKIDLSTIYSPIKIELRKGSEIWPEAPQGLEILNPAFDIIPRQFITGFITEFGVIKPEDLENRVRREYEWVS